MAKLLADMAVDMRDLFELGKLRDWDNVQAPNTNIASNFFGKLKSDSDIEYKFVGRELTTIADHPVSGLLKKIVIFIDDKVSYEVSGLSIVFFETEVQKPFRGNLEPRLFKSKDNIVGSDEGDTLAGYGGNDVIKGRDGDDAITGGKRNDKLTGGAGNDELTGGRGHDKFVFASGLDAATDVDTITDFTGKDSIRLDSNVFPGLGRDGRLSSSKFVVASAAEDGNDRILYHKAKGELYYDGDGRGADPATLFAQVDAGSNLSDGDFVVFS